MSRKWRTLACAAALALGLGHSPALLGHDAISGLPTVQVVDGFRAVCDQGGAGQWTFTVLSVSGNVGRVTVQVFKNARPTQTNFNSDGTPGDPPEYRVCGICQDPLSRPQQLCNFCDPGTQSCSITACVADSEVVAFKTIKNPVGGSFTDVPNLAAGRYCIRFGKQGGGTATVQITHPAPAP